MLNAMLRRSYKSPICKYIPGIKGFLEDKQTTASDGPALFTGHGTATYVARGSSETVTRAVLAYFQRRSESKAPKYYTDEMH